MSAARGIAAVGNITPNESMAFVIFDRERRGRPTKLSPSGLRLPVLLGQAEGRGVSMQHARIDDPLHAGLFGVAADVAVLDGAQPGLPPN